MTVTLAPLRPPRTPILAPPAIGGRSVGTVAIALLRGARPHQWIKNGAVLIVPGLSILGLGGSQVLAALGAFAAFCLAASSVYLLNDTLDRDKDARHPTKRHRPIASGLVGVRLALAASLANAGAAIVLGAAIGGGVAVLVALYLAVTAAYSMKLKHVAIVDVGVLSLGFALRVLAGAAAIGATAPPLLLVSVFWASVFIALGKRRSEAALLGDEAAAHRPALGTYTIPFLDTSLLDAELVSVLAFGAWILLALPGLTGLTLALVAAGALLGALGAYRRTLQSGGGGDPTHELVSNPLVLSSLVVCGLAALATGMLQ